MTGFIVSLAYGAAVIAIFSWDQFKRPSYAASKELNRLIALLAPPDLRRDRIYLRAYAAYVAILLVIYVLVCVYATVPVLQALGMGAAEGLNIEEMQSPVVPLAVSLAMVGIAPGFPVLQRFEEKIRLAAHHLSGIPARLMQGARILKTRPLDLPADGRGLLIPDRDWDRLAHYGAVARVEQPELFDSDLKKIVAFRAWILKGHLNVSHRSPRASIVQHEHEVEARIDRLILSLDSLSSFPRDDAPPGPPAIQGKGLMEDWEKLASEADGIASDVCALLMLRIEHGLLVATPAPDSDALSGDAPERNATAARNLLVQYLSGADRWAEEAAFVGILWSRATVLAVVTAFVWGIILGPMEVAVEGYVALSIATTYAFTAFLIYSLAIFIALSLHEHQVRREGRRKWPNMITTHWTRWMGPVSGVFVAAALVTLLSVVALSLYWVLAEVGFQAVSNDFWSGMLASVISEGPRALLGPILAVGLIASIDAQQANASARARWIVLGVTVGLMMVWSPTAVALQYQYLESVELARCLEGATDPSRCASLHFSSWADLIADHRTTLLLASLRSGLIGFLVLFVCQETLQRGHLQFKPTDEPVPSTGSGTVA